MPRMDGLLATRRVVEEFRAPPKIIILTTFEIDDYVYEALRAGANGFLLKDVRGERLVAGIRTVASGESLLAPSITRRLIESFVSDHKVATAPPPALDELTPRAGGLRSDRPGNVERRDRRAPRRRRDDGQDPLRSRIDEARAPGPGPGGDPRL